MTVYLNAIVLLWSINQPWSDVRLLILTLIVRCQYDNLFNWNRITCIDSLCHAVFAPSCHCVPVANNPGSWEESETDASKPGNRTQSPKYRHCPAQLHHHRMPPLLLKHTKRLCKSKSPHDVEWEPIEPLRDFDRLILSTGCRDVMLDEVSILDDFFTVNFESLTNISIAYSHRKAFTFRRKGLIPYPTSLIMS